MAYERKWPAVSPQAFTANGGQFGLVTVANTAGFRVKQSVYIKDNTGAFAPYQVKLVLSSTNLIVGNCDNQIANWTQISIAQWTVANGAVIGAEWQDKNKIGIEDINKAVYEADPVVAIRAFSVDQYGNPYTNTNPLPVAFDGTVSIGDVSIVEGGNTMKVNADGSINVIVEPIPSTSLLTVSKYNELVGLAGGSTSFIVTYTVPVSKQAIFQRSSFSGENIARYDLFVNGVIQDTARTAYGGDYTGEFNWTSGNDSGVILNAGDTIQVQVYNFRPSSASFEARIQVLEITI